MKYRAHSFEEKLEIVQKIESGVPLREISRIYKIKMQFIIEWNRRYKLYGEDGLRKKARNQRYNSELKDEIISLVLEKKVSLSQIAVYYDVRSETISKWIKATEKASSHSIPTMPKKITENSSKEETQVVNKEVLDKLVDENTRLKVELALLKKVRALVERRNNPRR